MHAKGYILVSRHPSASHANFHATLHKHGASSLGELHPDLRVHKVKVAPGQEVAMVAALQQEPDVEFAEVDGVTGPTALNDPLIPSAWHLAKIGAPTAWDSANGTGIVVAVVDGGVQANHPDLSLLPGWNVYDNTSNSADVTGHGTAVAGVIAALGNNGLGSAGVAYGAKILPIRATDPAGNGTFSSAASGIMWASDNGADVCNISWGNLYKSSTVLAAATSFRANKNGITVVSANNNGIDEASPAVADLVVVSGTQADDSFWPSSSFGQMVDIAAPCVNILTTLWNSQYNAPGSGAVGTSFATPIVSGTLALMKQVRPDLTAAQLVDVLLTSATELGSAGYDTKYGYGRVNAAAAVQAAIAFVAPVVVPTPTPVKKHGRG